MIWRNYVTVTLCIDQLQVVSNVQLCDVSGPSFRQEVWTRLWEGRELWQMGLFGNWPRNDSVWVTVCIVISVSSQWISVASVLWYIFTCEHLLAWLWVGVCEKNWNFDGRTRIWSVATFSSCHKFLVLFWIGYNLTFWKTFWKQSLKQVSSLFVYQLSFQWIA